MRLYDRLDVIVADVCCISPMFLHSNCRKTKAINARYILIKMKYDHGLSIAELALEFDRSWVHIYYILRHVELFMSVDKSFAIQFAMIKKRVYSPIKIFKSSDIQIGTIVIMRGYNKANHLHGVVTSLDNKFFTVESYHNYNFKETYLYSSGKRHPSQSPYLDIIAIEV